MTGADGFIGTVLCRRLDAKGTRVYRLSRSAAGPDTIVADLGRDPIAGLDAVRPEAVFHLAGRVHMLDEGPDAEVEHMRVTVEGTRYLLQAAPAPPASARSGPTTGGGLGTARRGQRGCASAPGIR